jgi:integrase
MIPRGHSPCEEDIKVPSRGDHEAIILTTDELTALADKIGASSRAMVYIGAVLGLRWAECAGLRVSDINLITNELEVNHQRTRGEKGAMVEGVPKSTAGARVQSVPSELMDMIRDRIAVVGGAPDAYLFTGARGGPLHYSNWRRRIWLPACEAIGRPRLQFHDLRRLNLTVMVESGVDVKTAQTRAGHSTPNIMLSLYAKATKAGDRAAADKLGAVFFPVRKNEAKILPKVRAKVTKKVV